MIVFQKLLIIMTYKTNFLSTHLAQRLSNHQTTAMRKRQSLPRTSPTTIVHTRLSTHHSDTDQAELHHSEQKSQHSNRGTTPKRITFTAGIHNRSHVTDNHPDNFSRTHNQIHTTLSAKTIPANQSHNQAPTQRGQPKRQPSPKPSLKKQNQTLLLKDGHILSWINEVLMQQCQQLLDSSIPLSAVKKYMIDRASLSALRISQQSITRIYRCMYIYSVGFSNFLKEVTASSPQMYINLWQVFALLLQYCSGGNFETLVTTLTNEKKAIIHTYQQQLTKKQGLIDHNDTLNAQKNQKMYKENSTLKYQNQQLSLEKGLALSDFKQAQNALGEEVSLRILFEKKINSIHCLYRELTHKHALLYNDFKNKVNEGIELTQQVKVVSEENIKLKRQNWGLQETHKQFQSTLQILTGQLRQLQQNSFKSFFSDHDSKTQKISLSKQIQQSKREIGRLTKQLYNSQLALKHLGQSYRALQIQYRNGLGENKQMINALEEQSQRQNRQFQERRNTEKGQGQLEKEKYYLQVKIKEKEEIIEQLKQEIVTFNAKQTSDQIQNQSLQQTITLLTNNLQTSHSTIATLKSINTNNQTLLQQTQIKLQLLKKQGTAREQLIPSLQRQITQLKEQITIQIEKQHHLNAEISSLTASVAQSTKSKQKSLQKLQSLTNKDSSIIQKLQQQLNQKNLLYLRYRQLYQSLSQQLNNQKFQRKTLGISYKHSLNVLENNNDRIRELNTKNSEIQERMEEEKRRNKGKQKQLEGQLHTLRDEKMELSEKTKALKLQVTAKEEYVHPMHYQQLISILARAEQQNKSLKATLSKKYLYTQNQILSAIKVKQLKLDQLQNKLKQDYAKKHLQLQYQQQKRQGLLDKIENLEMEVVVLNMKERIPSQDFKEKEMTYLKLIREQKQNIDEQMKEIEQMQHHQNLLREEIQDREKEVNAIQEQMTNFRERGNTGIQRKVSFPEEIQYERRITQENIGESPRKQNQQLVDLKANTQQLKQINPKIQKNTAFDRTKQQTKEGVYKAEIKQQPTQSILLQTSSLLHSTPHKTLHWRSDFSNKIKNASQYYKK